MKYKLLVAISIIFLFFVNPISATIMEYDNPWGPFTNPNYPIDGNCWNLGYFNNVTPHNGAWNVDITAKGVQICVNVTPPQGCSLNVTYEWLNYTQYYSDWLDWANAQPWGDWWYTEDWWDDIDWENQTTWEDNSYWYDFSSTFSGINQTTQICAYNTNVSCQIENDFVTEFFDWRINYTLNCSGQLTQDYCYYFFEPEKCSNITYIYPPSPNGTACPCCDSICIGANNTQGHKMNISIYGSYDGENYFTWNKYKNVSNDTYCFCMDSVYLQRTPSKKGEWIGASGISEKPGKAATLVVHGCSVAWEFSDNQEEDVAFDVRIPVRVNLTLPITLDVGWSSPATDKECNWNLTYAITAIDEDTDAGCEYYQDIFADSSSTADGLTMERFYITEIASGDRCIHFNIERDGNDPNDNLSDDAHLHGVCFSYYYCDDLIHIESALKPMQYNTTYYWYVNITDAETGEYEVTDTFQFRTPPDPSWCPCGAQELAELMEDTDTIKDDAWIVGLIFVIMALPLAVVLKNRKKKKKQTETYPMQFRRNY